MTFRVHSEFFDLSRPRVIAHRGASGTYPENTLPAFKAAAACGAPYIELDIHLTRDGEVVVSHDEDLGRVSGHDAILADITLAEVKQVDAGFNFSLVDTNDFPFRGHGIRVPTLQEVLVALPQARFIVELKPDAPELASAAVAVVRRARMEQRVMLVSEHHSQVSAVRRLAPEIPTNLAASEVGEFVRSLPPGADRYQPRGVALQIPPEHQGWNLVTRESVTRAHQLGLEVHVWTINEVAEMSALLALGVDGIITDFPERLLRLL